MAKWLGALTAAAVVGTLVACAPTPGEDTGASSDRITQGTTSSFDKDNVVTDDALLDKDALTTEQIQSFLDTTPWKTKSVLAGYTENGQSAAEIITSVAQKYGVNPIALLVRVQMEQSLLYKATAPDSTIKIAFGCGCPHTSVCSEKYEGFANQADCAAGTLSRSIAAAATSTGTASGWKKGVAKTTVDNVSVTPANAATAALYTYTPYVGESGGGQKGVGGAGLHKQVWDKVTTALSYTPTARATTTTTATNTGSAGTTTGSSGTTTGSSGTDTGDDSTGTTGSGSTGSTGSGTTTTGSGTTTTGSGTATTGSGTATGHGTTTTAGADDASLLQKGNAPPSSNNIAVPQSSASKRPASSSSSSSSSSSGGSSSSTSGGESTSTTTSGADSTDGTTSKSPVASGGCSSTGHAGSGSSLFAGLGLALAALVARRRR